MGGKWYRRYRADGYFVRGSGNWWFAEDAFWFKRLLLKTPIEIPFAAITSVRTGSWHAGKWVIRPVVVKLDWERDGLALCSGFAFCSTAEETRKMASHFEALASRFRRP